MHKSVLKKKKKTVLTFDRFRFATLKWLLHIAITTADWGRLYKLFDVLDASIDEFDFAMNSINWIIDTRITEKRSVYFARLFGLVGKMVVQCFDVNRKKTAMTGDQAYLLFAFNAGKNYV